MTASQKPSQVRRFRLAAKDREYLTANLAMLIKAAVPLTDALRSLADTTTSLLFKRAVAQVLRDIDDGLPLWKSLERSGVVSSQTLALVHLGEESGNLAGNLQAAAVQEQKQRVFRSKVRAALLYPAFVLTLTVVIGLGISWFLLPTLSQTFTQLHVHLPLITRVFLDYGTFLKQNGVWMVPSTCLAIMLLVYVFFVAPKTRHIGNALLFYVPGVSRLLYEIEIAQFGYMLGTLLSSGLSVTQSLDLLADSTVAIRYRKLYLYLRKSIDDGYDFRASFVGYTSAAKLFPATVQQVLIAGERSGSLAEALQAIGNNYEIKVDISANNLEVILEPILLVIVALGVLALAIAVILPIYTLTSGLSA
jgi:type II secretory pathway component PulF